ncbi:2-nitropropane dioxygenase [candidate division WOR-1 bacterium RIFOXYB2_FULL_42_35]|uniref:2-nitropropane dioxygenase n=1 Tax=candidate division WOR-1 bacterium RIFOXYC2_FULL_41_25 TaxID=1802586 RepID=A0A1F4TR93_UNCSA|nr:MAG: 2-nitropropane dioxygenase [candidate division WOR-1 bacterium RIFOXYA2_FULL_41_14]OGC25804.1 MAG: 2-nitropropane dioxygenase [candidate division WOR-1 bacterium RIFOXYB2_FULL_42_35]OGC35244.1 MAG: 2-nitropropane dioxygenase [candidate division WOR-1 bacterium RIFOXYC2_FULL_41_25]
MNLPELKIDRYTARVPIIQGGMAIRISTGSLAGAVAAAGGIGVIGASGMSFEELASEIKIARDKAQGGVVGINIMFAAREFWGIVNTAIKEKIDLIFVGAGFSRDIFKVGQDNNTPIVPIVSSARLAKTSERCGAAAIVVEGKEAGGHLGTDRSIKEILPEVLKAVKLPVIAAGGITNGQDIVDMLKMGASGVQIATRFVLSEECNAALPYKQLYQKATEKDIAVISSPVGLPGRAIRSAFVEKLLKKEAPKPVGCDFCLKSCSLEYCIIQALINALKGDVDHGVVFSGQNVWKIKDRTIKPAAEIINELVKEVSEL